MPGTLSYFIFFVYVCLVHASFVLQAMSSLWKLALMDAPLHFVEVEAHCSTLSAASLTSIGGVISLWKVDRTSREAVNTQLNLGHDFFLQPSVRSPFRLTFRSMQCGILKN